MRKISYLQKKEVELSEEDFLCLFVGLMTKERYMKDSEQQLKKATD